MTSRILQFVSALLILACITIPLATAASEYSITATPSIDTPERTVELEGETYTVSSVSRVLPGEEIQLKTGAPANAEYDIYLYNSERNIVDAQSGEGDDSVRFPTEYLDAGSYMAAIYSSNGNIEAIQPVIVAGYEASLNVPQTLSAGERLDATVSLQQTSEAAELQRVDVVVTQHSSLVERTTATKHNGVYTATFDSLTEGEYRVYAVARNETIVRDQHELIGVSDATHIQVEADDANTATAPDQSSSTAGGSAPESTATAVPPSTTATQTTEDPSSVLLSETETQTTSVTETDSTATTDSGVLTVPSTPAAQTTSTSSDGPWLVSLLLIVIGLALVLPGRNS